jgi:asparaginyl-tRNA synthetase
MNTPKNLATISSLATKTNQDVTLRGWISNVRSSGKLFFLELRDGSGFIQCVVDTTTLSDEQANSVKAATRESSAIVSGTVLPHPKYPNQYELRVSGFEIVQISEEFPIGRKDHGPDFLLENRHLWLRSKKQWAIQRIRNTIINATYQYFNNEGFIKIDSPIITANACEGTTTLFELDYFDLGKAYLSQSGQLYLEACIAAHGKVFDFGPVFRAEKSKTRKHLTEFWMMDAEMAFFTHEDNMALQEQLITFIVKSVLTQNQLELKILERDTTLLEKVNAPFPRITHRDLVTVLREKGSEINYDSDLGAKDEDLLAQIYDVPVFIEKWPSQIKAFYMKRDPSDPSLVLGADLMAPEGFGELIGGSQREDDIEVILEKAKEENLPLDSFKWYLDLRRYGSVPHSGFGFGLERLVAWIAGVEHIRETIPFPRMIYRITP